LTYINATKARCALDYLAGLRREIMTAAAHDYPVPIYEMMARLGIEPDAGVLPRLSLRYATALQRCEACRSKHACRDWLD
jgi:hypothetical protein